MNIPTLLRVLSLLVLSSALTGCSRIPSSFTDGSTVPVGRSDHRNFEDVAIGSTPLNWNDQESAVFTEEIRASLKNRDFAALDRIADRHRSSKARFEKGGGWKIHSFYLVASSPVQGSDWDGHVALLTDWNKTTGTISAKVTLAKALMYSAWDLRGEGYTDEVDPAIWPAFEKRAKQATDMLSEAAGMSEKCHGYYETVLEFSRATGGGRNRAEKAFREAVAFDKDYQYFYIEKATNLMPRWGGAPGELAAFAESLLTELGDTDGLITYFLIAADLQAFDHDRFFAETGLSWRKTKKGFVLYEAKYPPSALRVNQLAAMAWLAKDPQAACNAHKRLTGPNDFSPSVWNSREDFDARHKFVLEAMCKMPRTDNQAL